MHLFQTSVFAISRVAAGVACALLVGIVGLILYEIILRFFFATSTYVLQEFVGYGVATCTFLSLGYALEHNSLIRVNVLLNRVGPAWLRVLEALSALMTMVIVGVLIWFFWLRVLRHWNRGTVSNSIAEVPMWIPEGALLLGLGILWLQLMAYGLRQVTGHPPPVANTSPADGH
jgi:TRAP-type C4-dicarboxylate transport system permease small subunit